jgi:lipoprotein-anchoring transpeptidase ErfK/SrfK
MTGRLLVSAVVAVLATGCGGGSAASPSTAALPGTTTPGTPFVPAHVAKLMLAAPALSTPGGAVKTQLPTSIRPDGGPTQLLVLGRRRADGKSWLRVLLPTRPNGASGWIPRDDARLSQTPWKVVVSLADRRVYVTRRGRLVRSFPVVVGAQATPTPTGRFAVAERIPLPNPNQFYGSWMLTLTAHSTVLNTFAGGDGQVALHGRGGGSLRVPVGTAASHGCIRMRNADIAWLARHAEAGTPVIVVAHSAA